MKKIIILLALILGACSNDKVVLPDHLDRIIDLERRAALNDQLDSIQSDLIALNDQRITVLEGQMASVQNDIALLSAELDAAIITQQEGDERLTNKINTLKALIAAQAVVDFLLQLQINSINDKFPTINSKLTSLQNRLNYVNSNLNALESEVSSLQSELASLQSDIENVSQNVQDLNVAVSELDDRVTALENEPSSSGATVTTISLSGSPSCKSTGVSGVYAKRNGENVKLYNNSSCSTSGSNKQIAEIDPTPQSGKFAYYWLTPSKLAVTDGSSNANLKIIDFN